MSLYRTLSNAELLRVAEQDPRHQTDPLFTELVIRVSGASPGAHRTAVQYTSGYRDDQAAPELIDVRV